LTFEKWWHGKVIRHVTNLHLDGFCSNCWISQTLHRQLDWKLFHVCVCEHHMHANGLDFISIFGLWEFLGLIIYTSIHTIIFVQRHKELEKNIWVYLKHIISVDNIPTRKMKGSYTYSFKVGTILPMFRFMW
jgi:hypothetical protein